jgi:hypothetical protein
MVIVYGLYWAVIVVGYTIIGLGLSAFNYRIIHIRRILLTPYPNPHPHTIGFGLSTSVWISKTLLHIRIIRIRIGSDRMWKLSTTLSSLPAASSGTVMGMIYSDQNNQGFFGPTQTRLGPKNA